MSLSFIYLIQGSFKNISEFKRKNISIEIISLTYDKKLSGSIYFPKSSWAEGRNILTREALRLNKKYDYFIYLDDDIVFKKGDFDSFERLLEIYKPAVGCPKYLSQPTSKYNSILNLEISPLNSDLSCIAIHRDLILDGLVIPFQTSLDKHSWHFASQIFYFLLFNYYPSLNFLTFNNLQTENLCNSEYPKSKNKYILENYLKKYFKINKNFKKMKNKVYFIRLRSLIKMSVNYFILTPFKEVKLYLSYKPCNSYSINVKQLVPNNYIKELNNLEKKVYSYEIIKNNYK